MTTTKAHSKRKLPHISPVDRFLNRNSVVLFAVFSFFVLWAFWPSYFSHPLQQPEVRFHTHGLAMTGWCAMLIAQSYLIRTNLKQTHRLLGKLSYVLAPLIVVSTINLIHFRMQGAGQLNNATLYMLALMLNAAIAFAVLYGMAIYYRREPSVHARYMICTVFPLFTPVTDRLIFAHFDSLINLVPTLNGLPMVQVLGFILADILLVGLTVWDWLANRRSKAFAVALGLLLMYQISVLTFYRLEMWRSFGQWFLSLPLS